MQITRYTSLTEAQFLGCAAAFVDALFGELNAAVMQLRKLEGQPKGAAFGFEMALDTHRYGALLVLERWSDFVHTFGRHVALSRHREIIDEAPARVRTAENILGRTNDVLDAAELYSSDLVRACVHGFHSLNLTFEQEKRAVEDMMRLGPLLPEDFQETRRVFQMDLAAR